MKLSAKKSSNFTPHPETDGYIKAVIVDRTEAKKIITKDGEKEIFRYVFETECVDEENDRPFCIWSRGFTLTIHEKSALRAFLRSVLGRDLTLAEQDSYETDDIIGLGVKLLVSHNIVGETTYANIESIKPDRDTHLKPSGKYKRIKDRDNSGDAADTEEDAAPEESNNVTDWQNVVVHIGKYKGKKLGEVDEAGAKTLIEKWLPQARAAKNQGDAALISALTELESVLVGEDY